MGCTDVKGGEEGSPHARVGQVLEQHGRAARSWKQQHCPFSFGADTG